MAAEMVVFLLPQELMGPPILEAVVEETMGTNTLAVQD
jgi:hypothetical protein